MLYLNIIGQQHYGTLISEARNHLEAGELDESKILFEHLEENYPDSSEVYYYLNEVCRLSRLYEYAEVYAQKAVNLEPNNAEYQTL